LDSNHDSGDHTPSVDGPKTGLKSHGWYPYLCSENFF